MSHRTRAFTLVEMALVLILFGVLLGTTLPRLLSDIKTDAAKKNKNSVAEAREEITGYVLVNKQLPEAATDGTRTVAPTQIKARIDASGQPIVYILPNVNATGGALWEDDICVFGDTGLSVTGPGGTTDNVAFVVASPGQNHALDLVVAPPMVPGVQGAARTVTTKAFGADSDANPGLEFDDIVEFVTLDYLQAKFDCSDYTPEPPGSPLSTLPMDDMTDTNLSFGSGASIVSGTTAGGGIGNVLSLDGTADGAITVINSTDYRLDEFTIMGWFKTRDATVSDYEPIISRQWDANSNPENHRNFWVTTWANNTDQSHFPGEVAFKASRNIGTATPHFNVDTDAQTRVAAPRHHDANWHFFAVTMQDTVSPKDVNNPHRATVFVSENLAQDLHKTANAVTTNRLLNRGPALGPATGAGVYTMYIGKEERTGRYFDGYIDEIVIYNYALTDDEIGSWYNATRGYY